jgi:monoamine oxidase
MSSKSLPETFNPPDVAPPKPVYDHVCVFPIGNAKIITVAGQIGKHPDGTIPSTFTEQVSAALRNVKACLAAAGATPRDIVKVTHYVVNYDPAERSRNELCIKFLNGHKPPGTLVPVEKLAAPEILFEIEVMAIVQVDKEG